jgi:hypothetical protein
LETIVALGTRIAGVRFVRNNPAILGTISAASLQEAPVSEQIRLAARNALQPLL